MHRRACFHAGFLFLTVVLAACAPTVPEDEAHCALGFRDAGDVRVFVVGHAFSLEDAASPEHFDVSFREDLRRIAPCLSASRPNLLMFPEDAGLVAWFSGRRAMLARGSGDAETAFNAMYAGYYRQVDEYRRRFPGISAARALTLALGDVAWRAMDTTFGGIARRYGVYVLTSANVPYVERRFDDESVSLFRDPDAPEGEPAYVATRGECFNSALLYGPTGELLQRIDKVYLTDTEEDSLDLSYARLDGLGVFELPFGRVGAAISRDAFYAPFLQRMEDLGAELVAQPEAWSGWTLEGSQGSWLPDVILASGWTHTQKYQGFRHSAAPMLLGNLFDLTFDGQPWLTRKATPGEAPRGFVGSRPLAGWVDIGPWTFPDPVEEAPGLSLEARQARLRERGNALKAGSGHSSEGRYTRGVIAADLDLHGEGPGPVHPVTPTGRGLGSREVAPALGGHQTNPDAAYDAAGRLYGVFTDTREGVARVYLTTSDDDGRTWSPARPVSAAGAGPQRRPTVAAGAAGQVTVAWQQSRDGGPEQLHTVMSTDGAVTLTAPTLVEATGAAQWEPDLAYPPGGSAVAVVWTDFREGLAPKVRLARSLDGGGTWGASVRVDPGSVPVDRVEGSQLQPTVAWGAGGLAVAWLDYRERDWEAYAAVAPGGGDSLAEAVQVSPPSAVETLASDPQLAVEAGGGLVLVWDDQREWRGHHDVRGARLSGTWRPLPLLEGGAEAGAFLSRFRPSVAVVRGEARVVFQDLGAGKNGLGMARLPPGGSPEQRVAPERLDDTGDAANQLTRPRAVSRQDFSSGVVLFEDDRSGYSRVRTTEPL